MPVVNRGVATLDGIGIQRMKLGMNSRLTTTQGTLAKEIMSIPLKDERVMHVNVVVTAINRDTGEGAVYQEIVGVKKDGEITSLLGSLPVAEFEEGAMTACDMNFVAGGPNLVVLVTGIDGERVDWSCNAMAVGL